MALKDFFQKIRPVQLSIMLILTFMLFVVEMVVSYLTHSLTLLMDAYNMFCNIVALAGCIATIKYGNDEYKSETELKSNSKNGSVEEVALSPECQDKKVKKTPQSKQEKKLRNTFGWTRIDVITMLSCCVFLGSFSFSVDVEALQTLGHIDHQDAIHHPISVLCIGAAGLLLNALCYLLIGGYTFHQGNFLYVSESGNVVLNKVVVNDKKDSKRLSPPRERLFLWEMTRDITGCSFVIICALWVLFTEPEVAKFADPLLSLVSSTCIMIFSWPYIKESCYILLQTMPHTIDMNIMKKELVNAFPNVINVHDFHIWQLTGSKVIATVHIIFENPKVYREIMGQIEEFFFDNGVTQVTIQPEFFRPNASMESLTTNTKPPVCFLACQNEQCRSNFCCPSYDDLTMFKSPSKELLPTPEHETPNLKSVKSIGEEPNSIKSSTSTYSLNSLETKGNGAETRVADERNQTSQL